MLLPNAKWPPVLLLAAVIVTAGGYVYYTKIDIRRDLPLPIVIENYAEPRLDYSKLFRRRQAESTDVGMDSGESTATAVAVQSPEHR